jgi:hypothetical protein
MAPLDISRARKDEAHRLGLSKAEGAQLRKAVGALE